MRANSGIVDGEAGVACGGKAVVRVRVRLRIEGAGARIQQVLNDGVLEVQTTTSEAQHGLVSYTLRIMIEGIFVGAHQ